MTLVAAVVALLVADLPGDVVVTGYRVTVAPTPQRFVIVTPGTGARDVETYGGDADQRRSSVRLTITATMPEGSSGSVGARAEWLADQCESILTGARPVVTGKRIAALKHDLTRWMGEDESLPSLQSAYYVADFSTTVS